MLLRPPGESPSARISLMNKITASLASKTTTASFTGTGDVHGPRTCPRRDPRTA
ncbi:hypothetical protein FHS43_000216 [Streptosporangium becharense]|uniref:Uncharacterized protein n=1 Tax=Streptosporangium becharense TaxID=1816182 RepID=A0A7W9IG32_9ACTN|nr:hypothetical protein [Streptosporangium becharense]MBB5820012.1 hypothetical protein [Streptosporangium becharense]